MRLKAGIDHSGHSQYEPALLSAGLVELGGDE
jgi:hypothetical protein